MSDADFMAVTGLELSDRGRAVVATLRGVGSTGDDDGAEPFSQAEVHQPAGLKARPPITSTLEAVVLRDGNDGVVIVLVDKGSTGLTGLESGEVRLEGLAEITAVIRIRASGKIEVTAKAGQDVVVNGGTLKVARDTDPVAAVALFVTWISQVTTAVNALTPGAVTPFVGSHIADINGGAANFKG